MTAPGWYPDSGMLRYHDGQEWTGHVAPVVSDWQRREVLDSAVAHYVSAYGCRVESRTELQAVLVFGSSPNHVVWALLTLFSCGFLALGWLLAVMVQRETRQTLTVDRDGEVHRV